MKKKILPFLALILLMQFLVPAVQSSMETDKTTVVSRVIDGDTFDTTSGDRIRLADIDAPEKGKSGYYDAKNFLIELVFNKKVHLDIDDVYRTDKYGRLVCVVYVSYNSTHFKNVNKALLVRGYAVIWNFNNEFNPYTWSLFIPKEESLEPPPPDTTSSDATPPNISILSPENKTYTESSVYLNFTIDEATTSIRYRLDGGTYKTINGNTTLSDLSDGSHMLRVYANDMAQNVGASEVVYFTINTQQPEPQQGEQFTAELYMIAIVIIIVTGITLLALSRKNFVKPPS